MSRILQPVFVCLVFLVSASAALADDLLPVESSQAGVTKLPKGSTTVHNDNGGIIDIGQNRTSCYRFPGVAIPQRAFIEAADIGVICKKCGKESLRLSICGEYTQPSSEFDEQDFDLTDRAWTTSCTPPISGSVTETPYDVASVLQEIVDNPGWQSGNAAVFCFRDQGSKGVNKTLSSATLNASFSTSGPGGPSDCDLDTDSNGFPDLFFTDADNDGYCDFSTGKTTFRGILVLDGSFEVLGSDENGGGGIDLIGDKIRIVTGSQVISDLESPVRSAEGPGAVNGLVMNLQASSSLTVLGAVLSNHGSESEDESGDLRLSAQLEGARVRMDSPIVSGEDIFVESHGSIDILGQSQFWASGSISLTALHEAGVHNITLAGEALLSAPGAILISNLSPEGEVLLEKGVDLSAGTIDFCGVAGGDGKVTIEPGAFLAGTLIMPSDRRCGSQE